MGLSDVSRSSRESSMTTEEILKHVRSLPAEEQADLVDQLIVELARNGFHESVAEEWTEEIRRRVDDVRAGRVTCRPWEEVRDEILEKLDRVRSE